MTKASLVIAVAAFLISTNCSRKTVPQTDRLLPVIEDLQTDQNHTFLKTLRPSEADIKAIFKPGEAVQKVVAYSQAKWAVIDKVPEGSMKPQTADAKVVVLTATKAELAQGQTNGLSAEYSQIASHLKANTIVYGLQYQNPDGSEQKSRAAFFNIFGKWIIIPRVFLAFK